MTQQLRKDSIYILAAAIALLSGIQIVLLDPQPLFAFSILGGGGTGILIFWWLKTRVSVAGALSIMGIAILSGFLGSFAHVNAFINPLFNIIRWIAPCLLMLIGFRNIFSAKKIVEYISNLWGKISGPLLLFILYALSSAIYSPTPLVTIGRAATLTAITIGLAAALWPTIRCQADAETLLRLSAFIMALLILPGQIYLFIPESEIGWHGTGRFRSTFWNPVTYSHLIALLLPLYWWISVDRHVKSLWRMFGKLMVALLLFNLLLTGSRSATFAVLLSILLLSWYFASQNYRYLLNWLIVTLIILSIILLPQMVSGYFTRGFTIENLYQLTSSRIHQWERALELWSNSPILGYGFGNIGNTEQNLLFSNASSTLYSSTASLRLSNLYLETLASSGLIGLTLLLYLVLKSFLMFSNYIKQVAYQKRFLMIMAYATFISGLVLNLSETWLVSAGSPFAMYWWFILFIASRLESQLHSEKDTTCVY